MQRYGFVYLRMRIAINGMGRIGRLLARRLLDLKGIELIAVNDIMERRTWRTCCDMTLSMVRCGSRFLREGQLLVGDRSVAVYRREDPLVFRGRKWRLMLCWSAQVGSRARNLAAVHLTAGARRVMLSTTGSSDIPLLIYGYNHQSLHRGLRSYPPGGV